MKSKCVLLASFVNKEVYKRFINFLVQKNKVKLENIFIYEINNNDFEYLITFKYYKTENVNIKFQFNNAIPIHIKNGCLFSINGLNCLIKEINNGILDNNIKINWENYKDTMLTSNNGNVVINKIKKIN